MTASTPPAVNGLAHHPSHHTVAETLARLEGLLGARGIKVFARIDHSGEAARAGLEMKPTELLIFGNPAGGTPLMLAAPSAAIDLPLKLLVWEDAAGQVWITYDTPEYLQARHGFPAALMANIAVLEKLAAQAGRAAD
jgi:uncharacterized protein (DUF302 family)